MVFSPEAEFKFEVSVERSCKKPAGTLPAKTVFKLVFCSSRRRIATTSTRSFTFLIPERTIPSRRSWHPPQPKA
jgi:hypothetical protein